MRSSGSTPAKPIKMISRGSRRIAFGGISDNCAISANSTKGYAGSRKKARIARGRDMDRRLFLMGIVGGGLVAACSTGRSDDKGVAMVPPSVEEQDRKRTRLNYSN